MDISKKLHEAREAENALERAQSELVTEVVQSIKVHMKRTGETRTMLSEALNAPPLYINRIIDGEHVPGVQECEEIMVHIYGYGYSDDEYINAQEATEYMAKHGLSIGYRTVMRYCQNGKLPAVRQGVEWRIKRGDVTEFVTNYHTLREQKTGVTMTIRQFYESQGDGITGVVDGKLVDRVNKIGSKRYEVLFTDGTGAVGNADDDGDKGYYHNTSVEIVSNDNVV